MSFLDELKRRNVFRVAIAYAIASWLLLQIIDVVVPIIEAPEWVSKAILLLIAVGFPLALLFAWAFELTAEGLKFERDVDRSQSIAPKTGSTLDRVIIGILVIAVALFALDKFIWSVTPSDEEVAAKRSIAVLPFVNMSGDPEQVFFSDGISEEILNTLVRAEGISVASRTSSFNYRNHEQGIPEIAEALGVLFVLEGSVRKSGNQLRITAQLIDAEKDRHLWSETYDRDLVDIFAVQGDIANSITKAIHSELGIESDAGVTVKKLTENMTAYDLYLKGSLAYRHRQRVEDLLNAAAWLEQAVDIDPGFAVAWEALAGVYSTMPYWKIEDRTLAEYLRLSNEAADRALSLDPDLAYAQGIKAGNMSGEPPFDQVQAENLMLSALDRDPKNTTLLNWQGLNLLMAGHIEDGIDFQRRCLEIDPDYGNCAYFLVHGLLALGRYQEAEQLYIAHNSGRTDWSQNVSVDVPALSSFGNRLAAIIVVRVTEGMGDAPVLEFIRALENPDEDHSAGLRAYETWATKNNVDLFDFPETLAALGVYEGFDFSTNAEIWYWFPNYRKYRQSEGFKETIREYGTYDYWLARGFPPQCRPIGDDDFVCD